MEAMRLCYALAVLAVLTARAQITSIPGGGGGSGGGPPISGAATGAIVAAASATTVQTPSANATLDASGNGVFQSLQTGGLTPSASGSEYLKGLTSGGVALAVANLAGTAIAYVLPSTNGQANQLLTDTGTTICPSLAAGMPTTCHLLAWSPGTAQVNTIASTSGTTWLANNGTNINLTPPAGGGIALGAGANVDQFGDLTGAAAQFNSFTYVGTAATTSGANCTAGAVTGGATAGRFTLSGSVTSSCVVTVTMGSSQSAANGWICKVVDQTTKTVPWYGYGGSGAAATLAPISGTPLASDVVSFGCDRF